MSDEGSIAMSDIDSQVQDLIVLHQEIHDRIRTGLAALDAEALNWTPGPDTSSIGTIVTHALGAEAEMLRNLLEIPTDRVRDREFTGPQHDGESLLALLAAADADWRELAP